MTAPSQHAAFDDFRGCSPTLFNSIGPRGTAHQSYKYYMIYGGPRAGIYRDQSLAAEVAQLTKQRNPKGFNDEASINENWIFMCQNAHTHSPDELRPFVSPFPVQPSAQRVSSEPQPSRDLPTPTPAQNNPSAVQQTFSNAELIKMLTEEAAPFPHTPSRAGKSLLTGALKSSGGVGGTMDSSSKPPPVTSGSSRKQGKTPVSKSAAKPPLSYSPQKFRNVAVVADYGSGYPSSSSESETGVRSSETEAKADSGLDHTVGPCKFFVVKYRGGCDFYSSHSEALDMFIRLSARKLAPKMRVTEDRSLVEEFMTEAF
ncbi:hypothetical protein VKT23_014782 [Stygiomarasmius scandens]|uniref:BRCT domain-containing protein n=1 Tax=Marasmiellus scandens TaxID=2682957 RepID=A0ABR1IU96_9AGAR